MDDSSLMIRDFRHWSLFLNEDQRYLGRLCLVAKRADALDFLEMTSAEREEFFLAGLEARRALEVLFSPDLMNYASLGNSYRHLHVHLIPRYAGPRSFQGVTFTDPCWGRHYEPRKETGRLDPACFRAIVAALRAEMDPGQG